MMFERITLRAPSAGLLVWAVVTFLSNTAFADITNAAVIQDKFVYGGLLLAFIGFGLFGLAALLLSLRFPSHVRLFFLCGGSLSILLQYVVIWGDLNKYPEAFVWYDAFLLPGYVLLLCSVWNNWGAIFGLAIPALGVLISTLVLPVFWYLYFLDRLSEKEEEPPNLNSIKNHDPYSEA